jgi:hypothetical protein
MDIECYVRVYPNENVALYFDAFLLPASSADPNSKRSLWLRVRSSQIFISYIGGNLQVASNFK